MEKITSRKNTYISHIRALAKDADYRYTSREFLCDGMKLLQEAVSFGAEITSVLWKDDPSDRFSFSDSVRQYFVPEELFSYASPMANSPGPVFTVRIPSAKSGRILRNALILENVQDPGNVGTVIRTANAFGMDAVILVGACADVYSPKTARSTMGAIFRQNILRTDLQGLTDILTKSALPLYGAVLSPRAVSILEKDISRSAVAVGSEGNGLSRELIELCDGEIIIPMEPDSESLNAAVAASVIMWEMRGR
ncbi:MAG: RNA methyltransferase [Eubacteriales bacterium]|nr:RNA methyltransferase [Eubacteriales bacterium]